MYTANVHNYSMRSYRVLGFPKLNLRVHKTACFFKDTIWRYIADILLTV